MATVMENIPFAIDPKLSSCTATSESQAKIERNYTGEEIMVAHDTLVV